MLSFASIALFGVSTFIFAYWLQKRSKRNTGLETIPGPPTRLLFGNAWELKTGGYDFHLQLKEYADKYGHKGLFRLWMGNHLMLFIIRADVAEVVMSTTRHITKSQEYRLSHRWLGTGLLTSTGQKWHSRRKMITPTFHFRILNNFLQVMNEQVQILISHLLKHAESRQAFNITPYIAHCALDIICISAMGTSVNAQGESNSEYVSAVYRITDILMKRLKQPWFWSDFIFNFTSDGSEHNRCLKILHSFTNQVIEKRSAQMDRMIEDGTAASELGLDELTKAEDGPIDELVNGGSLKKKRLAFMDMLLYTSKTSSQKLDREDIREEVDTFMFEGHDTTAAALNWAVFSIGSYPEIQKQLQEEIDDIFDGEERFLTMEDLKKTKYMERVIKETLRLYPIVPIFGREIEEDCELAGFKIPKGCTAMLAPIQMHRDAEQFPDPDKFDPDLWLPENSARRHPFSFVPFSAGPRNCIGQKFAMMEMKVELAFILRNFNVTSLQRSDETRPSMELILRPENGILVKLEKRKSN